MPKNASYKTVSMQFKIIKLLPFLFFPILGFSQVTGNVFFTNEKGKKEPIAYANVIWQGTTLGTNTNLKGNFSIEKTEKTNYLVISVIGFAADTVDVTSAKLPLSVELSQGKTLAEFEIEYRKKSSELSLINPLNVTSVGEQELRKAACCNLSESFETNASIDASFTDAVTGTKQIKMLGLAGKYTQILQDNIPNVRGLSSVYGLTYIPGPWVGSIQISKGVGSVVNGYESIAGQINVDIKEPFDSEKFHLNLFGNQGGRMEANIIYQQKVGARFRTNFLLHGKSLQWEQDRNKDGFVDNALENDFVVSNLWRFIDDGPWRSEAGITFVQQNHKAGQLGTQDASTDDLSIYQVNIDNQRGEAFWKLGYVGEDEKSVGWQNQITYQETNSQFGLRSYSGTNLSYYSNLITQFEPVEGFYIKSGASFLYDDYQETLEADNFSRTEIVPGVFSELTIIKGNWSAIGGLRGDFHNMYGFFLTPRLHARYSLTDNTAIKLAAGKGQRTANIIAENIGMLASSRKWVLPVNLLGGPQTYSNLRPEVAYNYGLNLTHKFRLNYRDGDLSVDFYRTDFVNQIVVDLDVSPQEVNFSNLSGRSYSNSFQIETNYEIAKRTNVRLAYRFLDVKTEFQAGLRQVPLVASHRGFFNLGYETKAKPNKSQWKADFTTQIIGKQRLPDTFQNPEMFRLDEEAPAFVLMSAQVTRVFGSKFEVYVGGENLTNYRQDRPILANNAPFSKYFDASMVWGPIFGAMAYGGLRYVIE